MSRQPADREMSAFALLGFALVIVLLSVIVYFAWRSYMRQNSAPPAPTTTSAAPADPTSEERLIFGGLPRAHAPVKILRNQGYIVGYSDERKDPLWACYRVFHVDYRPPLERPRVTFASDPRTAAGVRSEDYSGSGYDRGHMAPNHAIAKCYGHDAQLGTFIVSNICPQRPTLNQKVWEALEHLEADIYPPRFNEVWVVDGPIFSENPKAIGFHRVQVPEAFYKIILEQHSGEPRTLSIIMPQTVVEADAGHLEKFLATIRQIQIATGIDFYPDLPEAQRRRIEDATPALW